MSYLGVGESRICHVAEKLERERFAWPKQSDAVVNLTGAQLNLLLDGYDIWRNQPHQSVHYASMY